MSRVRQARNALQDFLHQEAASGLVLLGAVAIGLVWFNLAETSYADVWERSAHLDLGPVNVHKSVGGWVESGLMALFFFVVGLELKREIRVGELRDPRVASVPIVAAVGGMLAPAAVFLLVSAGTGASDGWGIPVATDIALVLGILALLGDRVSPGLKLFMLTLAIVDDLLGIGAIALFYTEDLTPTWLAGAAVGVVVTALVVRRAPSGWVVAIGGVVVWYCTYQSGVKAALAGAALGLAVPAGSIRGRELLVDLEHRLHPWSAFMVLPLFGITSAAVDVSPSGLADAFGDRVTWAVVAGAVVGKFVGIVGATLLVVRLGRRLPDGVTRVDLMGGAALGGVGFSVALFIAAAAFPDPADATFLADARVGILLAGVLSALVGVGILTLSSRARREAATSAP